MFIADHWPVTCSKGLSQNFDIKLTKGWMDLANALSGYRNMSN